MKGLILAGGTGSRLYPITKSVNKQLLPVYNKPMIYYPMSVLMLAGIREILIISSADYLPRFQELLSDGEKWGLSLSFAVQDAPRGLADAFIVGEQFIGDDEVCLILGDNIFYGSTLPKRLRRASQLTSGGKVFAYRVSDPRSYAVVSYTRDAAGLFQATEITEKPENPSSDFVIPGLYFYDNQVIEIAKSLKPSARGELEITDVNKKYMQMGKLEVEEFGRGVAWLDVGSHETLLKATNFVQVIEERQGMMISCPEEIAYRQGFIDRQQLQALIQSTVANYYRTYLESLIRDHA